VCVGAKGVMRPRKLSYGYATESSSEVFVVYIDRSCLHEWMMGSFIELRYSNIFRRTDVSFDVRCAYRDVHCENH